MATTPPTTNRTPLAGVLTLTFLASLGTGGVTNGVFFLTESAFGYGRSLNYWLALFMGVTYIAAALGAGRVVRFAGRRHARLNARTMIGIALGAVGLVCMLPSLATFATGEPQAWTIWVLVAVFSPATGVLWPLVEAYLSGGRRGGELRRAIGRFNLTWGFALVVVFWAMAPLVEGRPLTVLVALGVVHLAGIGLLVLFPSVPGAHSDEHHEPEIDPARAKRLLFVFRTLMPVTYLVLATLSPFFPEAAQSLGVAPAWRTPLVSVWMIARLGVFGVLGRWHGWHGSWWMPGLGWVSLIAGFAACVFGPRLGGDAGVWAFAGGLAATGIGMSAIYVGSLYYGMEAGSAHVDAGGTHESLVGAGYAIGPACGLGALWMTSGSEASFERVLVTIVVVVCVTISVGGLGALRAGRGVRRAGP